MLAGVVEGLSKPVERAFINMALPMKKPSTSLTSESRFTTKKNPSLSGVLPGARGPLAGVWLSACAGRGSARGCGFCAFLPGRVKGQKDGVGPSLSRVEKLGAGGVSPILVLRGW